VKEKVGVIPMTVNLKARIESEEPPRRLHAVATAEHLTMAIDVTLQETGAATVLTSVFDVKGTGQLKAIVDRLFEKRATERTAQFAECLGKRFGAASPERPLVQPPAGWFRMLWQRILEWFKLSAK
jgi:carbon monoxide dehydrogenase subunit G